MELIIYTLLFFGCMYLVSGGGTSEWAKVETYRQEHQEEIESTYREVLELLEKASEVDALLNRYSSMTTANMNRIAEKYKEYDFVFEREERNKELRRYYANKSKRRKSW